MAEVLRRDHPNFKWIWLPSKIISGGQTGADRAGLDAAIFWTIEHGGYCPKGRKSEDRQIPMRYQLTELASSDYSDRTRANIAEADGTLIFTRGRPTGGSKLTQEIAIELDTPYLLVDLNGVARDDARGMVTAFIQRFQIETLNVAGSRESKAPGIHQEVQTILLEALAGRVERTVTGAGIHASNERRRRKGAEGPAGALGGPGPDGQHPESPGPQRRTLESLGRGWGGKD